ncbi:uncharacterized protein Bfra_009227 [Botrytis fragariae]|uniref:Uncharacterized protein n=1 Tax=Botrytis fragariae TaxID=1964551 RepID=A0A8H6ANU4_9HELO|nr:uncharacterized protein Bfra_009227 [Botrytis fragariae]KAF5870680.1 hypothetical protein Bfra_009227 [Botrytis fragariae]
MAPMFMYEDRFRIDCQRQLSFCARRTKCSITARLYLVHRGCRYRYRTWKDYEHQQRVDLTQIGVKYVTLVKSRSHIAIFIMLECAGSIRDHQPQSF